jgi:selenocysteine lyase/cysteine desulfurase
MNSPRYSLRRFVPEIFCGYGGFKLFLALFVVALYLPVTALVCSSHGVTPAVLIFLAVWWTASVWHAAAGFGLLLVFANVFWTDALRKFYFRRVGPQRGRTRPNEHTPRLLRVCAPAGLALVLLAIPILDLRFGSYWPIAVQALLLASAPFQYAALLGRRPERDWIPGIHTWLSFDSRNFNVAAMGSPSAAVQKEVQACLQHCRQGPNDADTGLFLESGHASTSWNGIGGLYAGLSSFLRIDPETITLHERTTAAIQFALEEVLETRYAASRPTLVTTDCEYPGIVDRLLLDLEARSRIRLRRVPIEERIWNGASQTEILETLVSFCAREKPDIIVISHVAFSSGFVMDIAPAAAALRALNPEILIIVDGAQAIGNIEVAPEVFRSVEYYAACAHKWLLAPPTLGLLVRNMPLLSSRHGLAAFRKPSLPHSSYPVVENRYGPTMAYPPLFALNYVLHQEFGPLGMGHIASHNHSLAQVLRREIPALCKDAVMVNTSGSIVSFIWKDCVDTIQQRLGRRGIQCAALDVNWQGVPARALRLSVHYFHSEHDVADLLSVLEDEQGRIASSALEGHRGGAIAEPGMKAERTT